MLIDDAEKPHEDTALRGDVQLTPTERRFIRGGFKAQGEVCKLLLLARLQSQTQMCSTYQHYQWKTLKQHQGNKCKKMTQTWFWIEFLKLEWKRLQM